jgi:epoxyqueuosine reductase
MAADRAPDLRNRIERHALDLGFDAAGVVRLQPSEHAAFYRAWLAAGRHGTMGYLERADAVARRLDPHAAWPELRSALVLAHSYITSAADLAVETDPAAGVIARYARGRDYHKVLRKKLLRLLERIEGDVGHPLPLARAYVDTGPVLERELAHRAGLGWFGRNTMLLHPQRGSYFFLATLLLELDLEPDAPFQRDHCGSCHACVSACPTGALLGRDTTGAPVIDATRCISYLTIEHRGPIPGELRPLIGNRVFGCDICQEVCPWNSPKLVQLTTDSSFSHEATKKHEGTETDLISLMGMNEARWDEFSRGSALRRAGYAGFKRNVAVALGNWGSPAAVPALAQALSDSEPLVRQHAVWALGVIGTVESRAALEALQSSEADPFVFAELADALARLRPNAK